VIVEVSDTGQRAPPELADGAREAAYATRPAGEGSGLGLALSESIVHGFGGKLELERRPGRTVVRVTLEASRPSAPGGKQPQPPARHDSAKLAILVIDDEEIVARALQRILTGHSVTLAGGGRQALDILAAGIRFDLIFCDLMMPDLTGMDVFDRLRSSNSPLTRRMVFMTGGTFTERGQRFRASVPNPFLEKPFEPATVRGVLQSFLARQGD
jgi:CheY-like chemotaxis protein